MKKIGIIILNYNGEKDTAQCLESIGNTQITNYKLQIFVVDNGSIQKFKVNSSEGEIRVIREDINLGFAAGNNVGIKAALDFGAEFALLLNNDTLVDKNLITELVRVAESDSKIGIVVPKIYFAKGFEFHKNRYKKEDLGNVFWYAGGLMDWKNIIGHHRGVDEVDKGQYKKEEETEIATGCCMLIKKNVFEKIGFLDEKYFLYYEDSDFSQRAKKSGFTIVYAPKGILWHKNAGSAGGSGSSLQDYYITRNRLIFGTKYAPLRSKVSLIRESIRLLINGRKCQKKGVLDFYLRKFGKGNCE